MTLYWGLRGPENEKLTVDIAVLGAKRAKRVLLHCSGIAGSAVQLDLLRHPPRLPADGALVIVHCLNPYGMAYLRRANENNVDLNRNFVERDAERKGAHDGYHRIHPLLTPASPPRYDFFTLRLLARIVRHGFRYLRQAGAEGQYSYPRGLFFGGHKLERGPLLIERGIRKNLTKARRVVAIDVHTGIGEAGRDWLILERHHGQAFHRALEKRYDGRLDTLDPEKTIAYKVRGGLELAIPRILRKAYVDFVTEEFGTGSGTGLLRALRDENRLYHHGPDASPEHPIKKALQERFAPSTARWRRRVLKDGRALVRLSARYLFE